MAAGALTMMTTMRAIIAGAFTYAFSFPVSSIP
jgi:hypothetical protein